MIDQKIPLPRHVGIIMDGNGRWATKRGLSRSMGHKAGAKALKKLCKHLLKLEIPYLSVFAFSTENFKRDKEEVDYLMNLFITMFQTEFSFLKEEQVRVVFSGRREPLPVDVLKTMDQITEETKDNKRATLNVCLNYGGQSELVDATKKIIQSIQEGSVKIDELNEKNFAQYLYQDLPPLDFVIRTSGEMRISNFMLWQASYAEFYFPDVLFPDFTPKEFDKAILEFQKRDRRFGGVKK